jgi:hypothetical protein
MTHIKKRTMAFGIIGQRRGMFNMNHADWNFI